MVNIKKYIQFLSFDQQILEINYTIDGIHNLNNGDDVKENINRKFSSIKELKALRRKIISDNKEIITSLCIIFVLMNSMSLNSEQNIMRKINPKSSNIDSFKYSILISLHYYDIISYKQFL